MEYRAFLDNKEKVGVIGLGVEHLKNCSISEVLSVAETGLSRGINYIDLVWSLPNVIEGISSAIESVGHNVYAAIHLGSGHRSGRYYRSRKPDECKEFYLEVLDMLPSKVIPIINIHYVNKCNDWKKYSKPGNILDAAIELKENGYGRYISVSTHSLDLLYELAKHPDIDSVMFQVNMANHNLACRDEALEQCRFQGKPVVAMKPYAGSRLLSRGKKTKIAGYLRAGKTIELNIPETMSSHKCLSYTLNQPGVCSAVTRPSNIREIDDSLDYLTASDISYSQELEKILEQI